MDTKTLNQTINNICARLPNWFIKDQPQEVGQFTLINGQITLKNDFKVGSRILLTGGDFAVGSFRITAKEAGGITARIWDDNDTWDDNKLWEDYTYDILAGFTYTLEGLEGVSDEWQGVVYGQRVPPDFIALCEKVAAREAANPTGNLVSEQVAGFYSKTLAVGADGLPVGWEVVFKKELAKYRGGMVTGVRL